jgi:hypothetical protein
MGGCVVRTNKGDFVRRISVNARTLEKVAEALGISQEDRDQFVSSGLQSIHIYSGPKPAPSTPQSQQSGNEP